MKKPKYRLISKTESAIFTAAFATLILALLLSLFLAQHYLVGTAQYWDHVRIERYMRLCQMALEAEARTTPREESLQKLRDIGLYPDIYPPDQPIPQPNPRYVPAIESVEMWGQIRDSEGKPAAVIRLSRHDINTRHTTRTVRLYTLFGAIGGTMLTAIVGLVLRRTFMRRIRNIVSEINAHSQLPAKTTEEDPLERLEQGIREMLRTQAEIAARSQQLLDGHSELACVESPDCTLREVNAAYCRLLGKPKEELVGKNYLDQIPPSDRSEALTSLQRLSRRQPVNFIEHRIVLPDGRVRWIRWRDQAVFDNEDNVTEVLSFGTDITPEKELATRLGALQVAFDQMQSLAETGSITWDFNADQMEWTAETRRLLGVDASTPASAEALLAIVASDDREKVHQLFRDAREQGRDFQQEFRVVLRDGSLRFLQSCAEVLVDEKTKLLNHLTCTLRDITALRNAEAATKRELRFREAIEQSLAAGIVVSDEKGKNLLVNPAFCAMTGWSQKELVGITAPYPYWPEEEIPAINEAFALAISGETPPEGFELKFCRKDGTRFDVLVKVAPLLDNSDLQLGWLGAVTDISALQNARRGLIAAEQELREELNYRQAIEKSTTVGLVVIGRDGRPLSANDAYCRMLGYSEEEILAWKPPYPCWPEEERQNIQRAFNLHLQMKTPPEGFQIKLRKKNGTVFDVVITASPIRDADGKQSGVLSALTDVTALQNARRELEDANERLKIAQDVVELGIWDWDPSADTLFWDRNSFAIFGHPEATDPKDVWSTVQSEEVRERLTYELKRLIAAGAKSGQDRLRVSWPDGSVHELLSTYVILRDASGHATRVVGVNRDVTAEIEEERELSTAHERLIAALEGGQFGTFEHVIGVGDLNWNQANYEINGIDPSITAPTALFQAWKEVAGAFFPELMAQMDTLPVTQNHYTYEFTARPVGKEPRRIRVSTFIERNEQGHAKRLVGVSRRIDA